MFALKVAVLLTLAVIASASDLDTGLAIMACAKRAISGGVPELGIPTHDPYVVLQHNFTWAGDLGPLFNANVNVTNMTWTGLATWNLTAIQRSSDNDTTAAFNFEIYWKYMSINGSFDMTEDELILHEEQHGTFALEWNHSTWTGFINVTKPTESSNGTVNEVDIDWHVDDLAVTVKGLGLLDLPIELTIATTVKTAVNTHLIGNLIGDFMKYRLTSIWWDTGKVWDLVSWCNANPEY